MKILVKFYLQSMLTQAERHFHLSLNVIQEPTGTTLDSELKPSISFMQEQGFFITYFITIIYMRVGSAQQLLLSTLLQWVTDLWKDCLCKTVQLQNSISMFLEKHSASEEGPDSSIKLEIQGQALLGTSVPNSCKLFFPEACMTEIFCLLGQLPSSITARC